MALNTAPNFDVAIYVAQAPEILRSRPRPVTPTTPTCQSSATVKTLPPKRHAPTHTLTCQFSLAVPVAVNPPEKEEEILAWWEENGTFKESLRLSEGRKPWSFYDGPPFATGLPHYGHILAGTIKVRSSLHVFLLIVVLHCRRLFFRSLFAGHRLPLRAPDRPPRRPPLRLGLPRPSRRVRDRQEARHHR